MDHALHVMAGVIGLISLSYTYDAYLWLSPKWTAIKQKWAGFFAPVKAVEQDSKPPVIYLSTDIVC